MPVRRFKARTAIYKTTDFNTVKALCDIFETSLTETTKRARDGREPRFRGQTDPHTGFETIQRWTTPKRLRSVYSSPSYPAHA